MNRSKVIQRSGGCCEICGTKPPSDKLVVHHIYPHRLFEDQVKEAHVIENLIALCRSCHGKAHAEINRVLGKAHQMNKVLAVDEETIILDLDAPCEDLGEMTNFGYDVRDRARNLVVAAIHDLREGAIDALRDE